MPHRTRLTVIALTAAGAVLAPPAHAVDNTMSYDAKLSYKGKPSKRKPANLGYTGTLAIDTAPPGAQPDIAPTTTIYFARGIKNNARRFPSCRQAKIDGRAFPRRCRRAIVGRGSAVAFAGVPGNPRSESVREDLDVKVVNGPRGRRLYLVVSSEPGAPVTLRNRVIPGTVRTTRGRYGFRVRFDVPSDLQTQLGLAISLTDFDVTISRRARRVGGRRISYLQLTSCRRRLPLRALTHFRGPDGSTSRVTSTGTSRC